MQTTKLLVAFLCANSPVFSAEEPASALEARRKAFQYHFGVLRGSSLTTSGSSLQTGRLQPAVGVQASAGDRGAAEAVSRPMSDEEWQTMFPVKPVRP